MFLFVFVVCVPLCFVLFLFLRVRYAAGKHSVVSPRPNLKPGLALVSGLGGVEAVEQLLHNYFEEHFGPVLSVTLHAKVQQPLAHTLARIFFNVYG